MQPGLHRPASPTFGREFTRAEWKGYRQTIRDAKAALDVKHLGLIAPVRSLPTEGNTGIGSLPGAKDFFKFISALGFDTVQVDPEGKTKLTDASPYTGTVFSTNPLNIDLKPLTTGAWAGILSAKTFNDIEKNNPQPDGSKVAYRYIFQAQEKAVKEAWGNYQNKLASISGLPAEEAKTVHDLKDRFENFIQKNHAWLEPDALYEALSEEYGNDYWPNWQGANATLDQNLFNMTDAAGQKKAKERITELKADHADTVGAYQFAQFIASEQKNSFKSFASKKNLAVMADRQVGFSDRDVWAYQKTFLKGWSLGCPPDYFSADGQAWGFPVLDPEKLFNPDGSLGEGGQLMQRLFEKIFEENPGGVRIDHIIGLIDPWVYPAGEPSTKNGGRLYSSPESPALAKYALIGKNALDQNVGKDGDNRVQMSAMDKATIDKYARILDQIVLPAAKSKGVDINNVICEDLGTLTNPVRAVLKARNLSGIRVTQFVDPHDPKNLYRGKNVEPRHWITAGTHDNEPLLVWSKKVQGGSDAGVHAKNLAQDLIPDPHQRGSHANAFKHNPLALLRAKFAELFASPAARKLVFFPDLFGQEEVYNRPGTSGEANWSLRIPKDFKKAYFEAVKSNRALNLPEAMRDALQARQVSTPALEQKLDRYAAILKE